MITTAYLGPPIVDNTTMVDVPPDAVITPTPLRKTTRDGIRLNTYYTSGVDPLRPLVPAQPVPVIVQQQPAIMQTQPNWMKWALVAAVAYLVLKK